VLAEDVPIYLSGIGTVQAYNTVNVQSRIDGEIMQIAFEEGQDVTQGDVLAIIDPRPLQAQLEQQIAIRKKDQALLDGAILDMKRYDTLVLRDFATRQQVDQQHALVDQYRAQVANDDAQIDYTRNQLNYTTIRAPIGGRVGSLHHDLDLARCARLQRQPQLKRMRAGFHRPEHRLVRVGDGERHAVHIPDDLRHARLDHAFQRNAIEGRRGFGIEPDAAVVFRRRNGQAHSAAGRRRVCNRIAGIARPGAMHSRNCQRWPRAIFGRRREGGFLDRRHVLGLEPFGQRLSA
jgi:hypothetical protein